MTPDHTPSFPLATPLTWVGRRSLDLLAYLGALASLLASAFAAIFRRSGETGSGSVVGQLGWMLGMGMPLVALVHVGIGSFLSMQSYFGGTFADGTGAVVGVGLIRNVASLMACLTLTGLLAARMTPELRALRRAREASPRSGFFEWTAGGRRPAGALEVASSDTAPRLVAAMTAGLVLSVWGTTVGMVVGWQVGKTMVGVSTHSFFLMFWDMIWLRDVVGLIVKGPLYGLVACAFACHEGFRGSAADGFEEVAASACRAACLAALTILVINSGWFILVYHAGPAFGPTLMASPAS